MAADVDAPCAVYPSCIQLEVTGTGSAIPTTGLVAFPGAYGTTDKGIVYNLYAGAGASLPVHTPYLLLAHNPLSHVQTTRTT